MSNSSRVRLALVGESTFGTTPSSAMLELRFSSQSLRDTVTSVPTNNIRDDANVEDTSKVARSVAGTIGCDIYPDADGALFELFRLGMRSTYDAEVTESEGDGDCNLVAGGKTFTHATSFTGLEVGDIIKISDAANSADNGFALVSALSGSSTQTITVQRAANFAGSDAVTVKRMQRIKNGTTQASASIEVGRLDVDLHQKFSGCVVSGFTLNLVDGQILQGTFDIVGQQSTRSGTAHSSGFTAANTNAVLDPLDVQTVTINGSEYPVQALSLTVNNNIAARRNVGDEGPQSMRRGRFMVTGSISAYFDSFQSLTEFVNDTSVNLFVVIQDESNEGWAFSLNKIKWTNAGVDTTGPDTDELKQLDFMGLFDPTSACTMRLFRVD